MLFRDEARLNGRVTGTSSFAADFPKLGPFDKKGRSLRDLDLNDRVFKYSCSYLIYSKSFEALPREMKDYLWGRLGTILTGRDSGRLYARMSREDQKSVLEILLDTKPEFKAWWRANKL
jgi:hypothetical protein